jgi:two-component system phosphate regulon sensor histidine kinase PhoR
MNRRRGDRCMKLLIFEPFYCVDKSRSKNLGGHGLGMAIAKSIIEKHNMEIRIFSELGKGTQIILSRA